MDYTTTTDTTMDAGMLGAMAAFSGLIFLLAIAAYVATSVGLMQFFKKAGKPGWAAFVPFYNYYVMTEIAGIPMYWFWIFVGSIFLSWIPVIGGLLTLAVAVYITHMFLQKYGKDIGHTILAILFPYAYFPIVGYSKDLTYTGSASVTPPTPPATPEA
jgi:hypothetical protein